MSTTDGPDDVTSADFISPDPEDTRDGDTRDEDTQDGDTRGGDTQDGAKDPDGDAVDSTDLT
ncbi:hypothetical protein JGU71_12545 [Antrihabitans sp. YC3-6]|uniref:Uncharacterized protein n=1 Tax=Antrihabitans stalagmiti TaxID=2799499 RepID=A0A934NQR6_9NOCA|nr:hypothetical protein [Antrihabitans stalagmiti]MBJ8339716.1 hypothetical protein [Antrihabitans stalagmiti]